MVDHWWCWPRNKVSLGNSASSQTCFDQNPPLANSFSLWQIKPYRTTTLWSLFPICEIIALDNYVNCGDHVSNLVRCFVFENSLKLPLPTADKANPCKSHNAHTEPSLLCFSGNLLRWNLGQEALSLPERWGLCLVLNLRKSEEENKEHLAKRTKEEMGSRKAAGDIISLSYKRLVNMAIFIFFLFTKWPRHFPLRWQYMTKGFFQYKGGLFEIVVVRLYAGVCRLTIDL